MSSTQEFEDSELHASLEIFLKKVIADLFTHLPEEVIPRKELVVKEDEDLITMSELDFEGMMTGYSDTWSEYSEYSHCVEAFLGSAIYTDDSLLAMFGDSENKDHIRRNVIPTLFGQYFERVEEIQFEEEAFDEVYLELEEYLKRDILRFRSWALLSNFEMDDEELVLGDDLRIRRVTPAERAEVKDSVTRGNLNRFDLMDDFLIEAEFELSKNPDGPVELNDGVEKFDAVMRALRLFGEGGDVRYKSVFTDQYPVNYSAVGTSSSPGESPRGVLSERCELSEEDTEEFEEFWSQYQSYFHLKEKDSITNPLRRFNQMDKKSVIEDAIIDSVIAFESTLLQEIGQTESYRFRMPLRASLLLDEISDRDRDFIYEFFRELYDARSAIVHRGQEINEVEIKDAEMDAREFTQQAREFLRQTLLEYVQHLEQEKSIQQVNQQIDQALRDAEYPSK